MPPPQLKRQGQGQGPGQGQPNTSANAKKRKEGPNGPSKPNHEPHKRPRLDHRAKQRDARQLSAQTSGAAFQNGELDVEKFVRAREYEIRALEEGMARSRKALNMRAFQQVPKELRRRTASHNVKRVPSRLRERSKREMVEDNTPTVTARRRKPTRHMRLRLETVKKLRALGSKKKAEKAKTNDENITGTLANIPADPKLFTTSHTADDTTQTTIKARVPRAKKATLATQPNPKAKFRKRQVHKSWLPTHLFHAKRAHMTPPSAPLWRFSIPLTSTAKSYRPTHRAGNERGAVAWDKSYMSTLSLEGRQSGIVNMLRGLGVDEQDLEGRKGKKWRSGTRVLEVSVYEREHPHGLIAPVMMIWCVSAALDGQAVMESEKSQRRLLLRVHPSAFFQVWEEVVRLSKVAKPQISVEDLRFAMGSIEVTGPGATEALLGALWPAQATPSSKALANPTEEPNKPADSTVAETWTSLAGLTNPALLPQNALLGLNVQDPRLHHPPRTINFPTTDAQQTKLFELLATWSVDTAQRPSELFDHRARLAANRALPSQKAINRRKGLAPPGQYPVPLEKDPRIPVLLYTSVPPGGHRKQQTTWNLLLPTKCVQPVWYSLMYYPLSTGQQPRFGGLDESRQLAFEAGQAWFPGDFPGTKAGWEWEIRERAKREDDWRRRPKSKRVAWEKVEVGKGRRGEVGIGWRCDWELLVGDKVKEVTTAETGSEARNARADDGKMKVASEDRITARATEAKAKPADTNAASNVIPSLTGSTKPPSLTHLPPILAYDLFGVSAKTSVTSLPPHIDVNSTLQTIRLTLLTRGVPQPCARIYRLPSADTALRAQWLALHPSHLPRKGARSNHASISMNTPQEQQQRLLAQSLLQAPQVGEKDYPACPGVEDLIGFITAGNFNLEEGGGTGVGCLVVGKVVGTGVSVGGGEGRLCVVRNAGTGTGRLARWEVI